ncbi:MAG: hypothetical protein ACE1Y7_01850, partial [Lysobacteraceae bacterium]
MGELQRQPSQRRQQQQGQPQTRLPHQPVRKPRRANIPPPNKVPMNGIRDKAVLIGIVILAVVLVLYFNSDDPVNVQKD